MKNFRKLKKNSSTENDKINVILSNPEITSIILKLPIFSGNINESLTYFLFRLSDETKHLNDQQRLEILCARLHGDAARKLAHLLDSNYQLSWSTTVALLQKFYQPETTLMKNQTKQQREKVIDNIAFSIRKIINKTCTNKAGYSSVEREKKMIESFINSMDANTQQLLKRNNNNSHSFDAVVQETKSLLGKMDLQKH